MCVCVPIVQVDLTKYVESHKFAFDEVFADESTNEDIYTSTCKPLVHFFVAGGKTTCFAYGQTVSKEQSEAGDALSLSGALVRC